jgi:hypothetical protein
LQALFFVACVSRFVSFALIWVDGRLKQLAITIARLVALLTPSGLLQPSNSFADGFRNPFQSGAANAQSNAFAARADDASAVFYNPAGMTQLPGIQFLGGIEFVNVDTHFRSSIEASIKNDLGGTFGFPPPAQFFITASPRDLGAAWLGDLRWELGCKISSVSRRAIQRMDLYEPQLSKRAYRSLISNQHLLTAFRMARSRLGRGHLHLLG